jgi:PAS domain S-box-containing protein
MPLKGTNSIPSDKLLALLQSSADILFEFDGEGHYLNIWCDDSSYLAKPAEEMMGKTIPEVLGTEDGQAFVDFINEVIETGETKSMEYCIPTITGEHWFVGRATRVEYQGSQTVLFSARNITDLKKTEAQLRHEKAKADRATAAKTRLVANVSHEVRTPMNGILGMTQLLLDTPLSPSQRSMLRSVLDCGNSLITILNDLLDFTQIEFRKLSIQKQDVELLACLKSLIRLFKLEAQKKHLEVELIYELDDEDLIVTDVVRLKQILSNLISNAIKYTDSGRVSIICQKQKLKRRRWLSIQVSDTGSGIRTWTCH